MRRRLDKREVRNSKFMFKSVIILDIIYIIYFLISFFTKKITLFWGLFWLFLLLISTLTLTDAIKYKSNIPYKKTNKKGILKRFFMGIIAGLHYSHFIGTYNHKTYNTQVFYPETLECYVGVSFAFLMIVAYIILTFLLKTKIGDYAIFLLAIPIITNIFSIILNIRTSNKRI